MSVFGLGIRGYGWALAFAGAVVLNMTLAVGRPSAGEMTFRVESMGDQAKCHSHCPLAIAAEGEIVESTPQTFIDFIHDNVRSGNLRSVVFINSQGGRVLASMELGTALRRLGAAVVVARIDSRGGVTRFSSARCLSACVYALMGGKERVTPPQSLVAIHRMFADKFRIDLADGVGYKRVHDDGPMARLLMRYSARMGVSRELVRYAERTSSDSLHYVTRAEMARWRLCRAKL